MELAERLGPSLDWWLDAPFALALLAFNELHDRDTRTAWTERMARIEGAELMAMAFHDPKRLGDERRNAILSASAVPSMDAEEVARARAAIEALERSGAMCDTPEEIAALRARRGMS